MASGKDAFSHDAFKRVNTEMLPRLDFLDTDRGKKMSDEEWVEEVVSTKLRASNYASALPSNSSATGADQAS